MARAKPTAQTLQYCKKRDIPCDVVERRIGPPGAIGVTKDLFGCIDLVALWPDEVGLLGIQATSGSNMASRYNKATTTCESQLRSWLKAGNMFQVWGWKKLRNRWRLRRFDVTINSRGEFRKRVIDYE
jgi:hypothetical protein